ncbi:hypothetical protein [Hyunsoonleella pacifica]|uniref:Uncharacterized protein n=1 Tax=Hyunsoonleella pacifica TaxID=1080224 RepID=A0A4Q9FQN1_9FLAO|nr:hypothetical protein [Hyunsoonleella pacifica]TBN15536.1 hypothetical protein EYD46_10400 [Hyunsoonleella pacifica]GGD24841.1 hypothetical protein GCM10011368_28700 [Hyunsoonleella pacifica]
MPFAESFQTTLKNNKTIMTDKSKHFKKTLGGFEWSGKNQFDFPEATPQQLKEIRESIQKENRLKNVKLFFILFVIGVTALLCLILLF